MYSPIRASILRRTFHLRYQEGEGTCFTIDYKGKRYVITARHIVEAIHDDDIVLIAQEGDWRTLPVQLVGHGAEDIDITVLAPQVQFGGSSSLGLTAKGILYAEDIYFLGFPFSLSIDAMSVPENGGFPLPLVKKAVLSGNHVKNHPILLDGHNNPGFSGGPAVRGWTNNQQVVIGVISGYQALTQHVRDKDDKETSYTYTLNTGIIRVHDIKHALALIEKNPIGLPIPATSSLKNPSQSG